MELYPASALIIEPVNKLEASDAKKLHHRGDFMGLVHAFPRGHIQPMLAPLFYAVGARGFTSDLINVFPGRSVAIHVALEASRYAEARGLINDMLAFEELRAEENNGTNVVVKTALRMMRQDCGPTRPPSAWPLTPQAATQLQQLLGGWDLLRD